MTKAQKIAMTPGFAEFAMIEAIKFLSQKTGISIESLAKQWDTNESLRMSAAKLSAALAEELAASF